MKYVFSIALVLAVASKALVVTSGASYAASFDCGNATTDAEMAVCSNPELSSFDDILASLFMLKMQVNYPNTFGFPAFLQLSTQQAQRSWIEAEQRRCNADVACLASAYVRRISQFYDLSYINRFNPTAVGEQSDEIQPSNSWQIRSMVSSESGDHTLVHWGYDNNHHENAGCLGGEAFDPEYALIAIHSSDGVGEAAVNTGMIGIRDNECLEIDVEISKFSDFGFTVHVNYWMSAGSWWITNYAYEFNLVDTDFVLQRVVQSSFNRATFATEKTTVDFASQTITFDFSNEGEEHQIVGERELAPGDHYSTQVVVGALPLIPFEETSPAVVDAVVLNYR